MSIDQLQPYYGLSSLPFTRQIAPGALYRSNAHQEARARIAFLIAQQGIGLVTGPVGAGKTCAARATAASLDQSRHTLIYLPNPAVGARGIYTQIVTTLGGQPRFHKATLIPQAEELLHRERTERHKTVIVILDEAHLLNPDQLEELRLLTNAEMDSQSPFCLLLLGQPQLRRRLRLGSFAALDQRVTLRYELTGMTPQESADYINHHLNLAGRKDRLFTDDALNLIHDAANGIPRALNNLATQALVAAYAQNKGLVDETSARAAITEVTGE